MLYALIGCILWFIVDVLQFYFTERYFAKKCNYDCSKCKNWHCQYHSCERKKHKQNISR